MSDTGVLAPPTGNGLTADGVAVLLVYGAHVKISKDGRPGIRVSAGYHDGSILLEAVGYDLPWGGEARKALCDASQACIDAGLLVSFASRRMSNFQARIVRRRPR